MTNLKEAQCYRLFDMLDLDKSGAIGTVCAGVAAWSGSERDLRPGSAYAIETLAVCSWH